MAVVDDQGWERVLADAAERPELHTGWIRGLANNSGASAAVLRRIVTVEDRFAYPGIWLTTIRVSPETFAELATHPDVAVRRALAKNEYADVEVLAMLAADAEPGARFLALLTANDRGLRFPEPLLARLLLDEAAPRIRAEARLQMSRLAASSAPALSEAESAPASALPKAPEPPLAEAAVVSLVTSPDRAVRADAAWDPRVFA